MSAYCADCGVGTHSKADGTLVITHAPECSNGQRGGFVPPTWTVEMISSMVPMSRELLFGRDRVAERRRAEIEATHAALLEGADPFRRAILELHAPHFWHDDGCMAECPGCDFSGCEGEPPEWPCRTYDLARDFT